MTTQRLALVCQEVELEIREKRSWLFHFGPKIIREVVFVELKRGLLGAKTVHFEEKNVLPMQCISVATLKATPLNFQQPTRKSLI